MANELEPGQSPSGGSGQEPTASITPGSEYGSEDFLNDLIADGIVSGGKDSKDKAEQQPTQERGAQTPEQSASKAGSEPGAEPRKDGTSKAEPGTGQEDPTQQAKADAQLQPPGEDAAQQLSPEEQARRDAQSWKDKAYAAEQEKQRLLDQFNVRQQADFEAQVEQQHIANTSPQRNLCNALYQQWQNATAEGDTEAANVYAQQWGQAKQTLDVMDWQYSQTLKVQTQTKAQQAQAQHLKVVDAKLKETFDTSVEELKKYNPKLNPFDPFDLFTATSNLAKDRLASEKKAVLAEAQKYRDEARTKWGATDPGSQPDRDLASGASGRERGSNVDYSGMSVDDIIADALADVLAPPPAKRR